MNSPIPISALSTAPACRVLVVEDHGPTRVALVALLEKESPDVVVVGAAADSAAALRLLTETEPDVVVLDLDLGGESGLDLMPAIRANAACQVVVCTASDDRALLGQAVAAGARTCISKLAPARDLIAAVRAAAPARLG